MVLGPVLEESLPTDTALSVDGAIAVVCTNVAAGTAHV
jgi:hypothetical protein